MYIMILLSVGLCLAIADTHMVDLVLLLGTLGLMEVVDVHIATWF